MLVAFILAAAVADATPPTPPADPPKKPEMICHKEEVLGTRFKKTVCMTKEQRDMRRAEDHKELERMQNQTGLMPST